jgi:hypothetical protein
MSRGKHHHRTWLRGHHQKERGLVEAYILLLEQTGVCVYCAFLWICVHRNWLGPKIRRKLTSWKCKDIILVRFRNLFHYHNGWDSESNKEEWFHFQMTFYILIIIQILFSPIYAAKLINKSPLEFDYLKAVCNY